MSNVSKKGKVQCKLCDSTSFFIDRVSNDLRCEYCGSIQNPIKEKYVKGYHSDFSNLPKDIKSFIKKKIDNPEKYMFDIDQYIETDLRNYWEK